MIVKISAGEYTTPLYFIKSTGTSEYIQLYDNGKVETNNIVLGKTYQYPNSQSDFNTKSNSYVSFMLSDGVVIGLDENTEFKLHTSTVDIINKGNLPSKTLFKDGNHTSTVMTGTIDIINTSSNGTFTLQTPRVSMTLKQGKFRIIVQGKTTIVVVTDGSVVLHKIIESKNTVEKGTYALINTYYSLTTRGMDVLNNGKATSTSKPILDDDLKRMNSSFDELENLGSNVLFVEVDGKTVGIKLR